MRPFTLLLVVLLSASCGPPPPPNRASVSASLNLAGSSDPLQLGLIPGATWDGRAATVRIQGHPVTTPGCSLPYCIEFDDAEGHRYQLGFYVSEGNVDATPPVAEPVGSVIVTWIQLESFFEESAVAVEDDQGLLLAANMGSLLLQPQDAGGLAMELGSEIDPTYEDQCGILRELSVTFRGKKSLTLNPGDTASLELGAGSVNVANVNTYRYVGARHCTDMGPLYSTLAWRSP